MIFRSFFSLLWSFAAFHCIDVSDGLKAIPIRTNITYFNSKYIEDSKFTITRYGRKSPYYFNMYSNILTEWNKNVTVHLVFNEFLNNEYKPSFIEVKKNICDFLAGDQYIGMAIYSIGFRCPIKPQRYSLENITFPTEEFPNVFPFRQGRVDVSITRTQDMTLIETGFLELKFELDRKKATAKTKGTFTP